MSMQMAALLGASHLENLIQIANFLTANMSLEVQRLSFQIMFALYLSLVANHLLRSNGNGFRL